MVRRAGGASPFRRDAGRIPRSYDVRAPPDVVRREYTKDRRNDPSAHTGPHTRRLSHPAWRLGTLLPSDHGISPAAAQDVSARVSSKPPTHRMVTGSADDVHRA